MVLRRISFRKQDRVIPPDHPSAPDPVRQSLKHRDHFFFFVRDAALHVFSISGQCKLKIVRICRQFIQPVQHRLRILRPEHYAVHGLRRQVYFTDLMRIHRISDINKASLYPVVKPLGIVIRDVCSAAYAEDHDDQSFFFYIHNFLSVNFLNQQGSQTSKHWICVPTLFYHYLN